MFIGTQVIAFNDNLYQLVKVFREKEGFPINEAKDYYDCDTVLRKEGMLYFCRLIQEAQIIEEIQDGTIQLVAKAQEESTTSEEGCVEG
jgi:hypothetical protein